MCLDNGVGRRPELPAGQGPTDPVSGSAHLRLRCHEVDKTFDSPADRPIVEAVAREPLGRHVAGGAGMDAAPPGGGRADRGATEPHHLADAVAALDLDLSDDDARSLEEPYVPQAACWY
jgi:hypothetical protein